MQMNLWKDSINNRSLLKFWQLKDKFDWGGDLNFIKEIPLKTYPTKVVKKFQNLKIWLKFATGNR